MTEFVAAVEAMSSQCESLDTPVISGNVSFYNETGNVNVTSTPSTGVVGLQESVLNIPADHFTQANNELFLLRSPQLLFSGQMAEIEGQPVVGLGQIDTEKVAQFTRSVRTICLDPAVKASRVVGKFGLAGTLAKMSLSGLGVRIAHLDERVEEFSGEINALFAESLYEVIVEVKASSDFSAKLLSEQWPATGVVRLGSVSESGFVIGDALTLNLEELVQTYNSSWEKNFETLA
jgi:phosphoribosylformylglycinamidine synthase